VRPDRLLKSSPAPGVGLDRALGRPRTEGAPTENAATWPALGAACDAVDALAAVAGARRLPPSTLGLLVVVAPLAAASGWWLGTRVGVPAT